MRNIKIVLEYDGTQFVGWQQQANGRSVQGTIEETIRSITNVATNVVGAGRTDAGVHARGQAANFLTESSLDLSSLMRALNGKLPEDIVVRSVEEVPLSFSARYDAKERKYRYFVSRQPTAISRKYCWEVFYHLNVGIMNKGCEMIKGTNDFQSFCKSESNVEHYMCTVFSAEWSEEPEQMMVFSICANRFLHGMVRALVGTMVDVGRGFTTLDQFREIIAAHDRTKAGMAAPAKGLFLEKIVY
jgi:tRNA pseudouridine38-40 synthase